MPCRAFRPYSVHDYRACTTSAIREAANGPQIVELVRSRSGIAIEIIDGDTEADTIFAAGGLKETLDPDRTYLYVDAGGDSKVEAFLYSMRLSS